jgi:sterol 14-demethylase
MFDEFRTLFREIENGVSFVSVFFPYIPIPAHRRRDSALLKITETLSEIVKSRRRSGGTEEDMMQRLIDSKYKDGRSMTEEEITGMIMTLLFAGKLTSAHTSTWTGACILSSTKCLTAVVAEQKAIIRKYNGQVDYNVLLEMDTLHNCIKEALRLHPSAPMLVRKAHKHFTVLTKQGNEYDIPKGHTLASPVVLNNSMPHIYKDPEVYDPDRFSPERAEDKAGGKFSYTSFGGGGNHGCFGEAYAYMQIKIIWSHLLRNFDLQLMSPFPKPDWSKFVLLPRGKVLVSYKRRQEVPSIGYV